MHECQRWYHRYQSILVNHALYCHHSNSYIWIWSQSSFFALLRNLKIISKTKFIRTQPLLTLVMEVQFATLVIHSTRQTSQGWHSAAREDRAYDVTESQLKQFPGGNFGCAGLFPPISTTCVFRWKIAFLWNIAKSFGGSTYTVTHQVWFYWKNTTMILISSPFPKSVHCQLCVSSSHLYYFDRVVLSVLYRIMLGLLWKYVLHGYIL